MRRRLGRAVGTVGGLVLVLIVTLVVFRVPLAPSLQLLAQGAFGDRFGIARTLLKSTPLLLTGLGMVVAWRAGVYNIGGEGQFVMGGVLGGFVAKALLPHTDAPALIAGGLILVACVIGGSLYAGLAGWLYVRRGVEAVISTILLNFIALQVLAWAVAGPLRERQGGLPLSDQLPASWMLPRVDAQADLHVGFLVALAAAVVLHVYLYLTRGGFVLRLVGDNARAAKVNGIEPGRVRIKAMLLSGALCGLAGGIEFVGSAGQLGTTFAAGWGFLGIPVALLGGLHPLVAVFSALFFGALLAGSENLARFTPAGTTLIYVIQGVAVLGFVALQARSAIRPASLPQ